MLTTQTFRTDGGVNPCSVQVHRHHPPLVYGRGSLGLAPEFSEGAAIERLETGPTGLPTFAVVTYRCGFPRPCLTSVRVACGRSVRNP